MKIYNKNIIYRIRRSNKVLTLFLFFMLSLSISSNVFSQRTCGTVSYNEKLDKNIEVRIKREQIRKEISRLKNLSIKNRESGIVHIPVVVHIVLNNPELISDYDVQSQIDVLNEDFNSLNSDIESVPDSFKNLIGNVGFDFHLAPIGPDCNGITRKSTAFYCFTDDDLVKSFGIGVPPIAPDRFLNIWVCNLCDDLLGYAQFPGGLPQTDGVVINYKNFGTGLFVEAPFDLGRTATHEVGHYFGLKHIWGDDENDDDTCSGSDDISDTPNQDIMNYDCPIFPNISCDNAPNGDLFMNYMDYVDDSCMMMFTNDQANAMGLELFFRSGLLTPYVAPSLSMHKTDPYCGPNTGTASVEVNDGIAPYSYLWSNGETTQTISNIPGGTYLVTVTDASLCPKVGTVVVQPEYHVLPNSPNWSSVVIQNNLDFGFLIDGHIYVEDKLFIDMDYSFSGVRFRMGPDAEIIIKNGVEVDIIGGLNNSTLKPCDSEWKGIVLEENALLNMQNTVISKAVNSITCNNNTKLNLISNFFEFFENGLFLDGDVEINNFKSNDFKYGLKGVNAYNADIILNLAGSAKSRNHFSFVDIGIKVRNSNANIRYNDIDHSRIGIAPILCFGNVIIKNNSIGYFLEGIFALHGRGLHIEKNTIGLLEQNSGIGIKIVRGYDRFVYDNTISATKIGVRNSSSNTKILKNVINVVHDYSKGVLSTGRYCDISGNRIYGKNMKAGIYLCCGDNNTVENNEIIANNYYPLSRAALIKLSATSGNTIRENRLTAERFSEGIQLKNSLDNYIECNEILSKRNTAINVKYNSEFQDILTNNLNGRMDLTIHSEIGVQFDKGNKFVGGKVRTYGLTVSQLEGSHFYANPEFDFNMPTDISPDGWFETDMVIPEICTETSGPQSMMFFNNESDICSYYMGYKTLKKSNPNLYFVKLFHTIRYLKRHNIMIPSCIEKEIDKVCGLKEILYIYEKFVSINKKDSVRISSISNEKTRELILKDRLIELKKELPKLKDNSKSNFLKEQKVIDTIKATLNSIKCKDRNAEIWKKVLLAYTDMIQGIELDSMHQNELIEISKLCSYDYGDVIHIARVIISEYNSIDYAEYDNCREESEMQYRKIISSERHNSEVLVYPNPTKSNIIVFMPDDWENGNIELYDLNGCLLIDIQNIKENKVSLDLGFKNGTYLLKLISTNGESYVKKIVIVK